MEASFLVLLLLVVSALDDELIGLVLLLAGLVAQCRLAPRSNRAGHTNRGLAFATAVGVITGVHHNAANLRTLAHVSALTSLTNVDVSVVNVAQLTDGSLAVHADVTHWRLEWEEIPF